jgi:hypothetical protein
MSRQLKLIDIPHNRKSDYSMLSEYSNFDLVLYTIDYFSEYSINQLKQQYSNIVSVINNNFTIYNLADVNFYGAPHWVANQAKDFFYADYQIPQETKYAFTFNINKKQINRFLLIKFVEYFQFKNYCYTWSGVDNNFDMTDILNELNSLERQPFDHQTRSYLLMPIKLEKNFVEINGREIYTSSAVTNYGSNFNTWNLFLNQMTYESAVSLIAESLYFEHAMTFTEKTLYSVLGLTFPIWIGGYKQATEWEKYGFDSFGDVIDHSYQNYTTLIERTYYAFKLNFEILNNLQLASDLRVKYMDRLLANRQLLLNNQLMQTVNKYVNQMPVEIRNLIKQNNLFNG